MAIKVSPEQLTSQGEQMLDLKSEYNTLFKDITKTMTSVNDHWSEYLSNNFSKKIESAQKSFSAILDALEFGGNAALTSADTFSDIDNTLAKGYIEKDKETKKQEKEMQENLLFDIDENLRTLIATILEIWGIVEAAASAPLIAVLAAVAGLGISLIDLLYSAGSNFESTVYLIMAKNAKTVEDKKYWLDLAEKTKERNTLSKYIEEVEDSWKAPHVISKGVERVEKTLKSVFGWIATITNKKKKKKK